jgi:hypothetical protein
MDAWTASAIDYGKQVERSSTRYGVPSGEAAPAMSMIGHFRSWCDRAPSHRTLWTSPWEHRTAHPAWSATIGLGGRSARPREGGRYGIRSLQLQFLRKEERIGYGGFT